MSEEPTDGRRPIRGVWLSMAEAALHVGLSLDEFRTLVSAGHLPAPRFLPGNSGARWRPGALDEAVERFVASDDNSLTGGSP